MKPIFRILSAVMILFLPFTLSVQAAEDSISKTAGYLQNAVPGPAFGQTGGEWTVIALLQSGRSKDDPYFAVYKENLRQTLSENNGILSTNKYTEYARVVLALTALGENPTDFCGYDLIAPLNDTQKVKRQGINGSAFALIALFAAGQGATPAAETYRSELLSAQQANGGFGLSSEKADTDVTAIAIRALCPYRYLSEAEDAVVAGLAYLSAMQQADGSFLSSDGFKTAESDSQVLLALKAAGLKADDPAFQKNGHSVTDSLLSYMTEDGGFFHTPDSAAPDLMASEQALLALTAETSYSFDAQAAWDFVHILLDAADSAEKGAAA